MKLGKLIAQIVKFGIVGFIAFCIDYGIFLALTYLFGVNYLVAAAISFLVSTVFNYAASMRYVFQGKETQTAMQQFTIFFVLSVFGLVLNQIFLWACVDVCSIAEWAGKLVATALVMVYNFITRKIFLEQHDTPSKAHAPKGTTNPTAAQASASAAKGMSATAATPAPESTSKPTSAPAPAPASTPAPHRTRTAAVYAIVVVLSCVAVFFINLPTHDFSGYYEPFKHESFLHVLDNNQYAYQARALSEGHAYLDLPVDEHLTQLANPYSFQDRCEMIQTYGCDVYWDYAYYDGHYYCYFGVVPAALVYLPYLLVTGTDLSTPDAVLFLSLLMCVALAVMVWQLGSWFYRRRPPLFALVAGYLLVWLASNVSYLAFVSRFYSVPILASLIVTALGLTCWFKAKRAYTEQAQIEAHLVAQPTVWLALGAFFMVMNFGCRPQFLLACFLAFPLFWGEIFKRRLLFSRTGLAPSAAIVAAILVCLAPLLYYNYIRFGSPLNGGSHYNLTGFDMQNYVQAKKTTVRCMYYYLLQLPDFARTFPWIRTTAMEFPYGWVPSEPMYGGVFFLMPLLLFIFASPWIRLDKSMPGVRFFRAAVCVIALVVLVVDIRNAGVTRRYFADFLFLASIVCTVNIWQLLKGWGQNAQQQTRARVLKGVVVAALAYSLLLTACIVVEPSQYDSIAACNPELYTQIAGVFGAS